ncbi:hypothetical protein LCGC14_0462030 [marine sediment metagenome]|uniref:Uncharacterized protein n=1 Tax=marine sediment metagenome TaxID=412755 RepID=A0A0F9SJY4_9ZZZZ
MNINTFLTALSQISQSVVKFLFASKWTFWIIGIIIVLYLLWKGIGKEIFPAEEVRR